MRTAVGISVNPEYTYWQSGEDHLLNTGADREWGRNSISDGKQHIVCFDSETEEWKKFGAATVKQVSDIADIFRITDARETANP